jgi:hypothetical protein
MKKIYAEPELKVRNYSIVQDEVLTLSSGDNKEPDLNDTDDYYIS